MNNLLDAFHLTALPAAAEAFRAEVKHFLGEHLPPAPVDIPARSWMGFDADFMRPLSAGGRTVLARCGSLFPSGRPLGTTGGFDPSPRQWQHSGAVFASPRKFGLRIFRQQLHVQGLWRWAEILKSQYP